jgi:hypothetical protein
MGKVSKMYHDDFGVGLCKTPLYVMMSKYLQVAIRMCKI